MGNQTLIAKERELVLAQLSAASPSLHFSVGSPNGKTYTRKEIIEHVEEMDEVGKQFIKTQMEFMRAFKSGDLLEVLSQPASL